MPRGSSLKPTLRKERVKKGLAAWCVNVPPELGKDGKRQQLFFSTKAEASLECEKLKTRKDNFGLSLTAMTPARIAEAAECYKILDSKKEVPEATLLEIVKQHFLRLQSRSKSIPFGQLISEYLAAKGHRSAKYLGEIKKASAQSSQTLPSISPSVHHTMTISAQTGQKSAWSEKCDSAGMATDTGRFRK